MAKPNSPLGSFACWGFPYSQCLPQDDCLALINCLLTSKLAELWTLEQNAYGVCAPCPPPKKKHGHGEKGCVFGATTTDMARRACLQRLDGWKPNPFLWALLVLKYAPLNGLSISTTIISLPSLLRRLCGFLMLQSTGPNIVCCDNCLPPPPGLSCPRHSQGAWYRPTSQDGSRVPSLSVEVSQTGRQGGAWEVHCVRTLP